MAERIIEDASFVLSTRRREGTPSHNILWQSISVDQQEQAEKLASIVFTTEGMYYLDKELALKYPKIANRVVNLFGYVYPVERQLIYACYLFLSEFPDEEGSLKDPLVLEAWQMWSLCRSAGLSTSSMFVEMMEGLDGENFVGGAKPSCSCAALCDCQIAREVVSIDGEVVASRLQQVYSLLSLAVPRYLTWVGKNSVTSYRPDVYLRDMNQLALERAIGEYCKERRLDYSIDSVIEALCAINPISVGVLSCDSFFRSLLNDFLPVRHRHLASLPFVLSFVHREGQVVGVEALFNGRRFLFPSGRIFMMLAYSLPFCQFLQSSSTDSRVFSLDPIPSPLPWGYEWPLISLTPLPATWVFERPMSALASPDLQRFFSLYEGQGGLYALKVKTWDVFCGPLAEQDMEKFMNTHFAKLSLYLQWTDLSAVNKSAYLAIRTSLHSMCSDVFFFREQKYSNCYLSQGFVVQARGDRLRFASRGRPSIELRWEEGMEENFAKRIAHAFDQLLPTEKARYAGDPGGDQPYSLDFMIRVRRSSQEAVQWLKSQYRHFHLVTAHGKIQVSIQNNLRKKIYAAGLEIKGPFVDSEEGLQKCVDWVKAIAEKNVTI